MMKYGRRLSHEILTVQNFHGLKRLFSKLYVVSDDSNGLGGVHLSAIPVTRRAITSVPKFQESPCNFERPPI